MAERVCYIQMSEKEYEGLKNYIQDLKEEIQMLEYSLVTREKENKILYNFFNRPAIEESVERNEKEFRNWCSHIAERYSEEEFVQWVEEKSDYYNSPLFDFAQRNGLHSKQEALDKIEELQARKYKSKDTEQTEGWSTLPYFKHSNSWILHCALKSLDKRMKDAERAGDEESTSRYCKMWLKLYQSHKYGDWTR